MVDIPTLSALIKEPGLCARSSQAVPKPASNTSLRTGTADGREVTGTASTPYIFGH